MNLNKESMGKIRRLILFTIFILVVLWNYQLLFAGVKIIGRVLLPFAIGGSIAFVLNVPMVILEEKIFKKIKIKRIISFIFALLLVLGLLSVVFFVIAPGVWKTLLNLSATLQDAFPKLQKQVDFDWDKMLEEYLETFQNSAGSFVVKAFTALKTIVSSVSTFLVSFVFACYLLFQKEKISRQVKKLMYAFLPRDWSAILIELGAVTHEAFFDFLAGQCVEAIIMGCLFFIVMIVFRFPYALLVSVITAFSSLIPIFGPFASCVVGALLIYVENPVKALVFVGVFLALQQIEGNFIYPYVVGNSVGLPAIWVLASVSVGGSLFGIVGMLLFVPIASVVYTILRGIVNRRLKEKEIEIE